MAMSDPAAPPPAGAVNTPSANFVPFRGERRVEHEAARVDLDDCPLVGAIGADQNDLAPAWERDHATGLGRRPGRRRHQAASSSYHQRRRPKSYAQQTAASHRVGANRWLARHPSVDSPATPPRPRRPVSCLHARRHATRHGRHHPTPRTRSLGAAGASGSGPRPLRLWRGHADQHASVRLGFKGISTICLSHLHADHVAGLPGLLLTIGNAGRTEPVDVVGPVGSRAAVDGLRTIAPHLPYAVRVQEVGGGHETALSFGQLATTALDHHLPCLGFRVDVPRARRFDAERARALGVPVPDWKALQRGDTVRVGERTVNPDDVLGEARRGLRLAYVTDTRPTADLPAFVSDADLLVCEGTYGDPSDAENAVQNRHMLFSEAAEIARCGEVRRLWLTHFSAKMLDPERYAQHATAIFAQTTIGDAGLTASLRFDDD